MSEVSRGAASLAPQKRAAHALKSALFRHPGLDARLDRLLAAGGGTGRAWLREHLYLWLLPERRLRDSPFAESAHAATAGRILVLTLVPPEDTGGGSRPAQLAAELHRRGWSIDWRYALPIYPWPAGRRPAVRGVEVRHVSELDPHRAAGEGGAGGAAALALLEAPHPELVALALAHGAARRVVYDAIDRWDGALGAGWYDRRAEDEAVACADVLVASSLPLRDELARRSGREVALLRNGFDPRRFDPTLPRARPRDVRPGSPTIGYVGALWGEWVDLDLVAEVARALPVATVHLIGPAGSRALPALPNLFALGPRPQAEIPAYLQALDVAIVPFAGGRLAEAVSPLKVFEYLAMRKPVVSTPLPELAALPGVRIADGAPAFAAAVVEAARMPFPLADVERFLAEQTWAERVDRLLGVIGKPRR